MKSSIVSVKAREVFSGRGHPGVEAIVRTENGSEGRAICTAGVSIGSHEIPFAYDGGNKWRGKGVQKAVTAVHEKIAPAIIGMDATKQIEVDDVMLNGAKKPGIQTVYSYNIEMMLYAFKNNRMQNYANGSTVGVNSEVYFRSGGSLTV